MVVVNVIPAVCTLHRFPLVGSVSISHLIALSMILEFIFGLGMAERSSAWTLLDHSSVPASIEKKATNVRFFFPKVLEY